MRLIKIMEKIKYIFQFNEDFKKIYEKEHVHLMWAKNLCQDMLKTTPTRDGDDYVYEFESAYKPSRDLYARANKIVINGKIVKNRYGHTDCELSDEEWAKIREHGKRNMEEFRRIMDSTSSGDEYDDADIIAYNDRLTREKEARNLLKNML